MNASVLVVEDDEDILRLLAHHLRSAGFDVLSSQDGYEALFLARQHSPQLILLDLMPRVSTAWKSAGSSDKVPRPKPSRSSC